MQLALLGRVAPAHAQRAVSEVDARLPLAAHPDSCGKSGGRQAIGKFPGVRHADARPLAGGSQRHFSPRTGGYPARGFSGIPREEPLLNVKESRVIFAANGSVMQVGGGVQLRSESDGRFGEIINCESE